MPRYLVSKEVAFEAAHFLREYNGKCENLHGHNWRVRATLEAGELDSEGMAFDFARLKRHLKDITDRLNHTLINEVAPFDELNPSAEHMAKYTAEELTKLINDPRVRVQCVEIWETPTSKAVYEP